MGYGSEERKMELWNMETEERFFRESLSFAGPEQLFYLTDSGEYVAYWPRDYNGHKRTLQSRNSLIGQFTERWSRDLMEEAVSGDGLFAVQGAVCEELELSNRSPADIVISSTNSPIQRVEDIRLIIEVKMSVVWNWQFTDSSGIPALEVIGDYRSHQGNPGLLRSDSMLKAIGKGINIRVSGRVGSRIPYVVLGNTPITEHYIHKVDHLKTAGVVQGFFSLNPAPTNNGDFISATESGGFYTFRDFDDVRRHIIPLITEERRYFSGMKTHRKLGEIIDIAANEDTYEAKAEMFLRLLEA